MQLHHRHVQIDNGDKIYCEKSMWVVHEKLIINELGSNMHYFVLGNKATHHLLNPNDESPFIHHILAFKQSLTALGYVLQLSCIIHTYLPIWYYWAVKVCILHPCGNVFI